MKPLLYSSAQQLRARLFLQAWAEREKEVGKQIHCHLAFHSITVTTTMHCNVRLHTSLTQRAENVSQESGNLATKIVSGANIIAP
jgi:hypothetical protein